MLQGAEAVGMVAWRRRIGWTLAVLAGCGRSLPAQQSEAPRQVLQRLGLAADALERSLPSFACTETVISEELRGGQVKRRVDFTANLRVTRNADGKLSENFQVTSLDGSSFSVGVVPHPLYVDGGFGRAIGYFATARQACYVYAVAPGRVDFTGIGGASPQCIDPGTTGFALLDAQGNITHIERRVTPQASRQHNLIPFASIDFAPVELNGQTFRLSHHMVAETPAGRSTARFEATYTDCHQFTATVTIGPATFPPDEPSAPR